MSRRLRPVTMIALAIGVAAVLALPLVADSYFVFQAATALSYLPALLGLVVITGLTGQVALGHGAFFALGAYSTCVLAQRYGWPFVATLPVSAVLNLALGILLGLPSLRLRGHYLAVLTLSVAVCAPQLFKHFEAITNGARGLLVLFPDPPEWTGIDATQRNYWVALAVAAVCLVATRGITRSPVRHVLEAIRDNELVAAALGADVVHYKLGALGFSAVLAGLGGSVFALVIGFVAPENFTIGFTALLIIGLVLGGKRSEWGAVLGSALVVAIPLFAGKVDQVASGVVFAVFVIGATFLAPSGLVGLIAAIGRWRMRRGAAPVQELNINKLNINEFTINPVAGVEK